MYKSLIDGHECTPQHYLVELVIQREAKKHGYTLPSKFWNTPEWKRKYKTQIIAANSLLKIFDMQDILDGLRCKEGNWIYSLQFKNLIDIINNEKERKAKKFVKPPVIEVNIDNSKETIVKPIIQKKATMFDVLEDIDADVQRRSF